MKLSTGISVAALSFLWLLAASGCATSNSEGAGGGPIAATVSGTIKVGTKPSGITVDPTANKIYVADFGTPPTKSTFPQLCPLGDGDVTVIDGATDSPSAISLQPGGGILLDPVAIALNETSHKGYVAIDGWGYLPSNSEGCYPILADILLIDTSTLTTVGVYFALPSSEGYFLPSIKVDQSTGDIYLSCSSTCDYVDVITGSSYTKVRPPYNPWAIAINETTNEIYVAGYGGISVMDGATNSVTDTIPYTGAVFTAIAVNSTTNTVYVTDSQSNSLIVIDGATGSVTATIPVGTAPSGVDVDPQTNFIYVANAGNSQNGDPGNVTVIDGKTNATTTLSDPNAKNPAAIAVNPVTNKIYVANSGSNNVTVIDGAHN